MLLSPWPLAVRKKKLLLFLPRRLLQPLSLSPLQHLLLKQRLVPLLLPLAPPCKLLRLPLVPWTLLKTLLVLPRTLLALPKTPLAPLAILPRRPPMLPKTR